MQKNFSKCLLHICLFLQLRKVFSITLNFLNFTGLSRICSVAGGADNLWHVIRFTYSDIIKLSQFFFVVNSIYIGRKKGYVSVTDAFAALLLRLADPTSLRRLENWLGWGDFKISCVVRSIANLVSEKYYRFLKHPCWINEARLDYYSTKIYSKGCPDPTVTGFIDGTRRSISRPIQGQATYYNGWLHNFNMLFIAIAFPDGTALIRGPGPGRWNDLTILHETGLDDELPHLFGGLSIAGDGIFPILPNLRSMKVFLSGMEPNSQYAMQFSSVRVSVEWLFQSFSNVFRLFQSESSLKALQTIPAILYRCACIFGICRNCLYGSQISEYFNCTPPKLDEVFPH